MEDEHKVANIYNLLEGGECRAVRDLIRLPDVRTKDHRAFEKYSF